MNEKQEQTREPRIPSDIRAYLAVLIGAAIALLILILIFYFA